MEWIEGTKLTDVQTTGNSVKENLALVKVAIDSTLSQLLVTGVLHADPHAGNLLKVPLEDGKVTLGYLDFGLLSTIPDLGTVDVHVLTDLTVNAALTQ